MRSALAVLALLACSAGITANAGAKASHEGWPTINGKLRINKTDRKVVWHGTRRSDELLGGHGSDRLHGRGASDVIWGDYKPCCQPGGQVDHLIGGDGRDFIYASHGLNFIHAGSGRDVVHAHFGRGRIDCGSGRDVVFLSHKRRRGWKRVRNCEVISYATERSRGI